MTDEAILLEIEKAGEAFAVLVAHEMALEADKPLRKAAAIGRLIGTNNPDTGKPHSASSAEKVVEGDREYATFLVDLRNTTYQKIVAGARYESAKARGRMAAAASEVLS